MQEFLDAVDVVCMNCHYGEESCETCPVRATVEELQNYDN